MKYISISAMMIGIGMLVIAGVDAAVGHPPFAFVEAFLLAAIVMLISAVGGFEWGLTSLMLQALAAGILRDAWGSVAWLVVVACVWYVGATLLAVRGSRVLMGIAAGALFAGLLLERFPTFTFQQWLFFFALLFLEISGMYLAGNAVKGRWFSPYV
jgi:hypothetical protein